ncbi:hypothetical protein Cfor_01091 [Coptotermes formosanus]|uniref:Uncharacterized protein n=1 Tax=Coptotermes formosanus TaxID=36987 RepID=A0A6L2PRC5_COPFO|nr:hypothetical protein Cfor_01091 [Coptotermes formosanus]
MNTNVLAKVVTVDESWAYGYDPKTEQHSTQWKIQFLHGGGGGSKSTQSSKAR